MSISTNLQITGSLKTLKKDLKNFGNRFPKSVEKFERKIVFERRSLGKISP